MTGPSDERLALYRDLKDSALRRSAELAGGVFVVEGMLALQAVLASPYPLRSLLVLRSPPRIAPRTWLCQPGCPCTWSTRT